jgi:hypothetical protein
MDYSQELESIPRTCEKIAARARNTSIKGLASADRKGEIHEFDA